MHFEIKKDQHGYNSSLHFLDIKQKGNLNILLLSITHSFLFFRFLSNKEWSFSFSPSQSLAISITSFFEYISTLYITPIKTHRSFILHNLSAFETPLSVIICFPAQMASAPVLKRSETIAESMPDALRQSRYHMRICFSRYMSASMFLSGEVNYILPHYFLVLNHQKYLYILLFISLRWDA